MCETFLFRHLIILMAVVLTSCEIEKKIILSILRLQILNSNPLTYKKLRVPRTITHAYLIP